MGSAESHISAMLAPTDPRVSSAPKGKRRAAVVHTGHLNQMPFWEYNYICGQSECYKLQSEVLNDFTTWLYPRLVGEVML